MSKKKSLGHNPLTSKSKNKATLNFIKNKLDEVSNVENSKSSEVEYTFKLNEDLVEEVYRISQKSGESVGDIINNCLKKYIEEYP